MIVYDVTTKVYLAQSNFLSMASLAWSQALHLLFCFSQEKPLRWKEKHTHTHSHTHTHTHTHSSPANDSIQSNDDTSTFANRIETLQNFLHYEIYDLRSEMKKMHEYNKTNDSLAECNKSMELMGNQINLQEECNFKTKLINSLLDNLFNHESHRTKLHNDNATLTHSEADSQFPKWQACKRICQSQSNPKLTLSNRYESLRDCDIPKRNDNVIIHRLPPEEDASEKNVKTSDTCKQNY